MEGASFDEGHAIEIGLNLCVSIEQTAFKYFVYKFLYWLDFVPSLLQLIGHVLTTYDVQCVWAFYCDETPKAYLFLTFRLQ